MPPRYHSARELNSHQRRRVMRVLSGPIVVRSFLPAFGVWWAFIITGLVITHWAHPEIDTNGWMFIAAFFPTSCLVLAAAMAVGHVRLIRWLINYRTARRGRLVAMRDVLCPSDTQPSRWRRWWLSWYGITRADLELIPSLWHPTQK